MNTNEYPKLAYRIQNAAALLDVSAQSIRRLIRLGVLRPVRILGGIPLIPAEQLERLLVTPGVKGAADHNSPPEQTRTK